MNKKIYIDITNNHVVSQDSAQIMTKPNLIYGSAPYLEFHLLEDNVAFNASSATAWQVSIDVDFDLSTQPMTRSIGSDIDSSGAASGIIIAHVNTNTQKFQDIVNGKDSVNAQCEMRGFDGNGDTIYCVRFALNCLGAVDLQALSAIPIPDNIASKSYVIAITSGFQSQINALNSGFAEVIDVVEDLSGTVEELADLPEIVYDLSGDVETANSKITALSSITTTHTGNIAFLSAAIDDIQPQGIEQLRTDINAVSGNLNSLSTTVNDHIVNSQVHVTSTEKATWNAKSDFSGSYNDLTNRPDLTIYETKTNVATISSALDDKIDEVSGKIPTSVGGIPINYVTSSYQYTSGDAGKFFYIDEDDATTFSAQGYGVSPRWEHTLTGHQLYAALKSYDGQAATSSRTDDLNIYSQPAIDIEISGKFDGVDRYFEYYGTYLNAYFNVRLPIWKDNNSNYYLYGARNWSNQPEWCVTTYLPSDNSDPQDNGLFYTSPMFGKGTLLHPLEKDFNNSNWDYDDGPYSRTVSATFIGSYPQNDVITDTVKAKISGWFTRAYEMEFTVGSATIYYTDVMEEKQVSLNHYTASWHNDDNTESIYIGMGYSDGTQGNMPGTYIKVQVTDSTLPGDTQTFGKFGSIPLTGATSYTTFPTAIAGEYRDLARINEWDFPSEYYTGIKETLYDVKGDRKGEIVTEYPAEIELNLFFAKIPLIKPERLIF